MDYLLRPRSLDAMLREMDGQLEELWAVCTKMSTSFGQVGGRGGGGGDAKDGAAASYSDFVLKRERVRKQLEQAEDEILTFLRKLEGSGHRSARRDAEILRWRYVFRFDWDFIHRRLVHHGYRCETLRTVYNWHTGAVIRAAKYWEETHDLE